MPFKFRRIKEDEGMSWQEFCKATTPPPVPVSEPQPLGFTADEKSAARARPRNYMRVENVNPSPSHQTGR